MIDPTQPLPDAESEKQENNRNPSWFQPGQSGNPKGRPPKGYSITEAFRSMLGEDMEKKTKLVNNIFTAAVAGDMVAAKMIWSYMDGMPSQAIDHTTLGDKLPETKTIIIDTRPKESA